MPAFYRLKISSIRAAAMLKRWYKMVVEAFRAGTVPIPQCEIAIIRVKCLSDTFTDNTRPVHGLPSHVRLLFSTVTLFIPWEENLPVVFILKLSHRAPYW